MMGGREVLLIALLGLVVVQGQEKRKQPQYLKIGRTSNNCQVDMDCPDNAFCRVSTYCVCKEGYVYTAVNSTHKSCLKEANFGEECTHNIQCQAILGTQSECKHGVCRCVPTAHWDVRCFETALVGERCTVDQNCYLGETGPEQVAYCVRGYCTCPLQSSPRDNGTRCVRDSGLGGPCEDQLQCAGAGLECQGTCQCRKNWVAHNDSKICVEAKEIYRNTVCASSGRGMRIRCPVRCVIGKTGGKISWRCFMLRWCLSMRLQCTRNWYA
ncbi:cell death abnormality protein 1-like isoform X3 [Hyposmocoma kahamanoa]|uniref:cell death abnormality protein 1-like isoform X3 n=1 Tax=Hyposmocoma kahamanoa TaxID=1477025 RepID=UPI000E6D8C77|nr:cell death abnormality protein 1-like isoform X3 [Hyposmocoma kahamanoa]